MATASAIDLEVSAIATRSCTSRLWPPAPLPFSASRSGWQQCTTPLNGRASFPGAPGCDMIFAARAGRIISSRRVPVWGRHAFRLPVGHVPGNDSVFGLGQLRLRRVGVGLVFRGLRRLLLVGQRRRGRQFRHATPNAVTTSASPSSGDVVSSMTFEVSLE